MAETSLTVPGIKYVIDPGTARISRYSYRTKVQRLPIEPVSRASGRNQRKGRCGRVSEGICIRLYSEDDFLSRPEFTDPEILRTNLASVILQMTACWGWATSPRSRLSKRRTNATFRTACVCWKGAGAITTDEQATVTKLTPLGRQLSQLPVDRVWPRMVLEAQKARLRARGDDHHLGALHSGSRERPMDKQQASDENIVASTTKSPIPSPSKPGTISGEQQKALSSRTSSAVSAAWISSTTCACASGRISTQLRRW